MTTVRLPSSIAPDREAALAGNPCGFQIGIIKNFPSVKITPAGIEIASFVEALRSVNCSYGIRFLVNRALTQASKDRNGDGLHFTAADIRATAFFDGLTTGIIRNGFNPTRFAELMEASANDTFGARDVARMVRWVAAEQAETATTKAKGFTLFEHSAIRQVMAGGERIAKADLEAFFSQGQFTDHFMDPANKKSLPRIAYHTALAAMAYGVQAALGEDVRKLTPLPPPPAAVQAGAQPALEEVCPYHRRLAEQARAAKSE